MTFRRLLGQPDFRRWFVSRSVSQAGNAASVVALPLLTYRLSGSPVLTAAVTGIQAAPYLLFGLIAGAAADRMRRKPIMVTAELTCALLLGAILGAKLLGLLNTWHVLAAAFGIGCAFCWFDAAAWGSLARLVGKPRLAEANSLLWSTETVLGICVPGLAGLLVAITDPTVVLAADAGTYALSAVLLGRLRGDLDPAPHTDGVPAGRRGLGTEIGEGLRYLWREPVIRVLSLTGFGFSLSAGGAFGLLVVHADQALGVTAADRRIGLLYAAAAVGSLVATLLLPSVGRRAGQGSVSIAVYGMVVVSLVGLAVNALFVGALLLWAVWEFARTTGNLNGVTVRQQLTPDALQGRVNTTGRMIAWGGTPFGALAGGMVAQSMGAPVAYAVLAVPVAVGFWALLASPVRRLRL